MATLNKRIILEERDLLILKYLFEYKVSSSDLIKREFFSQHSACYRRLRRLMEAGFVQTVITHTKCRQNIFGITALGIKQLGFAVSRFDNLRGLTPKFHLTTDHDLAVQVVRQALITSPVITQFTSENSLAHLFRTQYGTVKIPDQDYKLPDGAFTLWTPSVNMKVALEVEISKKSKSRLQKAFELLITGADFNIALYVVKDSEMLTYLKNIYETVWNRPSIQCQSSLHSCYFALLDDLVQSGSTATILGLEGSLSLKQL
ncbi:MAG: replication-relaxation family protein [Deltaproteobacteria bacterium]|nr:replication-relaxation family protein [Deltaproteobacteria bacterium]